MHELLGLLLLDPLPGSNITAPPHDVVVALIVAGGTVLSGLIALIVAGIQRERSGRSTVESNDKANATERTLMKQLLADKSELEEELALLRKIYAKLRESVVRHGLDPDTLIAEGHVPDAPK